MKKILFIILLLPALMSTAQLKKANLRASGLTCAMCSKAIYKAITAIPFVEKVDVDIEKSIYTIAFKQGLDVVPDALARAVVDAGFSVAKLDITADLGNVAVKKGTKINLGDQQWFFVNAADASQGGEQTFTIIDKQFVSKDQFKKYSTGLAAAVKTYSTGFDNGKRLYHVTL